MSDADVYRDLRSDRFRAWFEKASDYGTYLSQSDPVRAARWQRLEERIPPLDAERRQRLRGHGRKLDVLVLSGVWCGDCVRQGPMIRQVAETCGRDVRLRLIDRDLDPELRDELRILGAMRVPVAVFLSEDFFEVGRFGDRSLSTYRRKAAIELGAACPVPAAEIPLPELVEERDEWADVFERMLLMLRLAPSLRARHGD